MTTLAGDPLTVAAPITIQSGGALGLTSGGTLTIDANITAQGAVPVSLAYNTAAVTNLSFAQGAALTYTNANGSAATAPVNGQALTINGTAYTLLYSLANTGSIGPDTGTSDVAGIDSAGDTKAYAIATNLTGTGTAFTGALAGASGDGFSGTLEGLGHTVNNLTITGGNGTIGLIGDNTGTVRDIGVVGGSVSGSGSVGGLVGQNDGTVTQAYATGAVSSTDEVGGLVGLNFGTVTQAYATGAVSGTGSVGGLVGDNAGTITQAYATGAVSGSIFVGGLVGFNAGEGTITQAYATGAVSGSQRVGGLVGANYGTVTNSAFDTSTTGNTAGIGVDFSQHNQSANIAALTTAQLQSTATTNPFGTGSTFSGGAAGVQNGVYPYLTNFFPDGVQAVSGLAYTNAGTTLLTSPHSNTMAATTRPGLVTVVAGGTSLGTSTTGANGYYYVFSPLGSVAAGAGVVAYTAADPAGTVVNGLGGSGAQNAASFIQSPGTASNTSLPVYGTWLAQQAGTLASLSTLNTAYATAIGATAPSGFTLANREIDAPGAFTLDALIAQSGTLVLTSPGAVTQTAQTIDAASLLLGGTGTYTLTAANSVATIAANTGAVSFTDTASLETSAVTNDVSAATAGVTTTGAATLVSGGSITIAAGAPVSGTSAVLAATGAFINQDGGTAITATSGRWLVYSSAAANDTFGGLNSNNTAIFDATYASLPPGSVTQTGDRYLFANQPTLTVTTTSDSKTYGMDVTARVATDYTITGFDPGVTGVYLGDTAATATSGTPSVTSTGSAATASVAGSTYAINATQGSLASPSGYGFAFADTGMLMVNPASLTYTANAASRTYGAANPALSGTITGFVAGDTQASATMGTATFTTPATSASNVGTYAINGSGLTANNGNYVFSQAVANATALTINPALLSVSGAKTYDATTGFATGRLVVAGAQNGENVVLTSGSGTTSSADAGTYAGSSLSNLAISVTGGNAMASNYTLPATGALVIGQATITVAGATGVNKTYDATTNLPNGATGFTYTGVIGNNATVTATSAQYASANAGMEPVNVAGLTIAGAAAGDYVLSATSVTGSGTISPAAITVTANGGSSIYGQTPANPGLSATGLQGGQTVTVLTGLSNSFGITGQSNAGTTTLSVQGMLTNANYTVTAANTGTFTVAQRSLAIAAVDQQRAAGTANPPLTYQVGATTPTAGLVNGDGLTGSLATTATQASPAGAYAISQGTLAASGNYIVGFTPGTLTVEPAAVVPVTPSPEPTLTVDLSSALLASTANRAFEEALINPSEVQPFISSAPGDGTLASQIVRGLSDPRFDAIIVCVKDVCTLVAPRETKPLKTSRLETPSP